MRDSYQKFFEYFKIEFKNVIKFDIDIDTIYPDPKKIITEWKNLIYSIEHDKKVYIRGYERDAHGTTLYQELYKKLLNNNNITKDSTNNDKPTQLLQKITGFSKTIKKDSNNLEKISNYQVSHIFGRTKNPFLFTAPWNIVWKPKILDPFTGHESKGTNTDNYKKTFLTKSKKLYSNLITEYNQLAKKYFSEEKLEKAFNEIELKGYTKKEFEKFKEDARKELQIIN